jgi:hypothetical protein
VPPAPIDIKFAAKSLPHIPSHNQQQQQPPELCSTLARIVWTKSNIAESEISSAGLHFLVNQTLFLDKIIIPPPL